MRDNSFEISKNAIQALEKKGDEILTDVINQSMQEQDEIAHHGEGVREILEKGMIFTHQMLLSALRTGQSDILVDQANWAVNRLPHDNIQLPNLIARLTRYRQAIINQLPGADSEQITPFLDILITSIQNHVRTD
ncbi:hypothetical protein KQH62_01935 [bacterium]|nr:hypothetical protein [bacterium]